MKFLNTISNSDTECKIPLKNLHLYYFSEFVLLLLLEKKYLWESSKKIRLLISEVICIIIVHINLIENNIHSFPSTEFINKNGFRRCIDCQIDIKDLHLYNSSEFTPFFYRIRKKSFFSARIDRENFFTVHGSDMHCNVHYEFMRIVFSSIF